MEKPITVIDREYREQLIKVTNEAKLPTFMKLSAVKELCEALKGLDQEERANAEREWSEALAAEAEEKGAEDNG